MYTIDRHRIGKCSIGATDLSDHNLIYLHIHLNRSHRNTLWKLNVGLINNLKIHKEVKKEIKDCIEEKSRSYHTAE